LELTSSDDPLFTIEANRALEAEFVSIPIRTGLAQEDVFFLA
jgi:hypothetical protein